MEQLSKKRRVILELFRHCRRKNNFEFDNELVREISKKIGFGNPHDATKVDHSNILPDEVRKSGYCIVHLGRGRHRFVQGSNVWYHLFEEMSEQEKDVWDYTPRLLDHTDTSESNIISMVYNQRLIHKFLYGNVSENPNIYLSRRTKISQTYKVGQENISTESVQMEMDATFENNKVITILEGKNGFHADFSVYQLFHPFLYYHYLFEDAEIDCCYLLHNQKEMLIRLYLYTFSDATDMGSIFLKKKVQYSYAQKK